MMSVPPSHAGCPVASAPAVPPPPLDQEIVDQIAALVNESSGGVMLGKICASFPGVKRAQLEGLFSMVRQGDQWKVHPLNSDLRSDGASRQHGLGAWRAPGGNPAVRHSIQPLGFAEGRVSAFARNTRAELESVPSAQNLEVPILDETQLNAIVLALQEAGGALPLGRVSQICAGVKRPQLEPHFELSRVGSHGQWEVRLPGVASEGMEQMVNGQPLPKDALLPEIAPEVVAEIREVLSAQPDRSMSYQMVCGISPGVKRSQLEKHFDIIRLDKKRFAIGLQGSWGRNPYTSRLLEHSPTTTFPSARQDFDVQKEPSADLPEILQCVEELIGGEGGVLSLDRISSCFNELIPEQLQGHFYMERKGDHWIVFARSFYKGPAGERKAQQPWRADPLHVRGHMGNGTRHHAQGLKRPRLAGPASPNGAHQADLAAGFLNEISLLVIDSGGSVPLGRVAQVWPHVSRAQLEGHFRLERSGDQWQVCL